MSGSQRIMHYVRLGRIAYTPALNFQYMCADAVRSGKRQPNGADGVLLLLEHDPVFTVGLRQQRYPENVADDLRKLGADFQRTNRGGLITFHGPGQLVAYPILHMQHWGLAVRSYVDALEQSMIRTCAAMNVHAERSAKYTGVWVGRNKIGAIGVHTGHFVTTHGLALNCSTDLRWFEAIVPCGIRNRGITSLSRELDRTVTVDDASSVFLKSFAEAFKCHLVEKSTVEDALH